MAAQTARLIGATGSTEDGSAMLPLARAWLHEAAATRTMGAAPRRLAEAAKRPTPCRLEGLVRRPSGHALRGGQAAAPWRNTSPSHGSPHVQAARRNARWP